MRRRRVVVGVLAVGLLPLPFAALDRGRAAPVAVTDRATDTIRRGDLEGSTTAAGTLRFADQHTVQAARAGIVTGLPAPGAVVRAGGRLYAVDNVPVLLLQGRMPAWRDFEIGMDDGPDVKQLERNLRTLGFFDRKPDRVFTWATRAAVRRWQKAAGLERTGRLALGSVVFAAEAVRVGAVSARVGDRVGVAAGLFAASSTTQVVETSVKLSDQRLAVVGTKVSLRFPDGASAGGVMSSVGTPTEKDSGTVIPVVVTLDDPAAAGALQEATVTVSVPSRRRRDVLSVPVGALLALDPRRFGVEVAGEDGSTARVAVTVGMFAAGRVEISGAGLRAGQHVVVPSR